MPHEALVARHAIRNVLAMHSRGVDRADANLLGSAYHPDATVDYGFFAGPAATLVTLLAGAQKAALPTLHRTGHCAIRVQGRRAVSESQVIAYVEEPGLQRMVFGRYLDSHECRNGVWRLTHRTYVLDGNTNRPGTAVRTDPPLNDDHFVPEGGKGAADPARALLACHHAATRRLQECPPMPASAEAIDAALAREEIRLLLAGYARAVDRADSALMASLFWDDAEVVSGIANGPAATFARDVTAFVQANYEATFHSIANEWIEVRGDHAVGEHYVIAHARGGGEDVTTGGRYLDRYERRAGTWKIASRVFISDWNSRQPTSHEAAGFYEGLTTRGCFGINDPIYKHWESL